MHLSTQRLSLSLESYMERKEGKARAALAGVPKIHTLSAYTIMTQSGKAEASSFKDGMKSKGIAKGTFRTSLP